MPRRELSLSPRRKGLFDRAAYRLNSDSKLSSASRRWALRMQQQMLVSDVVTMSGDTWADDSAA
ncbi:MAG: hypothetical protein PHO66_07010 [Eubacteriales bacterium]|nr:hypothetical protein [Eubacteriales bacterium]